MDQYQNEIEQLAQRIRNLEMDRIPECMPGEVRSMVDEMDLIPVSVLEPGRLDERMIMPILEEMGYKCQAGLDFVMVETEEKERIQITYGRLPIISVIISFRLNETEESMECLRKAVLLLISTCDMIKAAISEDEKQLAIYLHARHTDVSSFKENIRYYIDSICAAADSLRESHREYYRDRMLDSFIVKNGKQIYS